MADGERKPIYSMNITDSDGTKQQPSMLAVQTMIVPPPSEKPPTLVTDSSVYLSPQGMKDASKYNQVGTPFGSVAENPQHNFASPSLSNHSYQPRNSAPSTGSTSSDDNSRNHPQTHDFNDANAMSYNFPKMQSGQGGAGTSLGSQSLPYQPSTSDNMQIDPPQGYRNPPQTAAARGNNSPQYPQQPSQDLSPSSFPHGNPTPGNFTPSSNQPNNMVGANNNNPAGPFGAHNRPAQPSNLGNDKSLTLQESPGNAPPPFTPFANVPASYNAPVKMPVFQVVPSNNNNNNLNMNQLNNNNNNNNNNAYAAPPAGVGVLPQFHPKPANPNPVAVPGNVPLIYKAVDDAELAKHQKQLNAPGGLGGVPGGYGHHGHGGGHGGGNGTNNFFKSYGSDLDAKTFIKKSEQLHSKGRHDDVKGLRIQIAEDTIKAFVLGKFPKGKDFPKQLLTHKIRNYVFDSFMDSEVKFVKYQQQQQSKHDGVWLHIVNGDSIDVALIMQNAKLNPVVLNMANATRPGGGWAKGASAQEESLFRRSNYYRYFCPEAQSIDSRCLNMYGSFIWTRLPNSYRDSGSDTHPIKEGGCVYSKDVIVIRHGESKGYEFYESPKQVSFIAACAPKYDTPIDSYPTQDEQRMINTIKNILYTAKAQGHDSIVLGALGCGAFKNPPAHVALLFRYVLFDLGMGTHFKAIAFAIIEDHNSLRNRAAGNIKPFTDAFRVQTSIDLEFYHSVFTAPSNFRADSFAPSNSNNNNSNMYNNIPNYGQIPQHPPFQVGNAPPGQFVLSPSPGSLPSPNNQPQAHVGILPPFPTPSVPMSNPQYGAPQQQSPAFNPTPTSFQSNAPSNNQQSHVGQIAHQGKNTQQPNAGLPYSNFPGGANASQPPSIPFTHNQYVPGNVNIGANPSVAASSPFPASNIPSNNVHNNLGNANNNMNNMNNNLNNNNNMSPVNNPAFNNPNNGNNYIQNPFAPFPPGSNPPGYPVLSLQPQSPSYPPQSTPPGY